MRLVVFAVALGGCIDDFDDPKGYGTGTTGDAFTDCRAICVESARCEGAEPVSGDDCEDQCQDIARITHLAGCEDAFEALIECYGRAPDVCDALDVCEAGSVEFFECYTNYCELRPQECGYF